MIRLTKKRRKEIERIVKREGVSPIFVAMLKDLLDELDRKEESLAYARGSLFDQITRYSTLLLSGPEKHLQLQREALKRMEKALGRPLFLREVNIET